jgi:hypothetical protein
MDATQYGQFSAHLSSYRHMHINQERLSGEKAALAPSLDPSHRPFLPEKSLSMTMKAEPGTAHEESFQLDAIQYQTESVKDPDGEVHYKQGNRAKS